MYAFFVAHDMALCRVCTIVRGTGCCPRTPSEFMFWCDFPPYRAYGLRPGLCHGSDLIWDQPRHSLYSWSVLAYRHIVAVDMMPCVEATAAVSGMFCIYTHTVLVLNSCESATAKKKSDHAAVVVAVADSTFSSFFGLTVVSKISDRIHTYSLLFFFLLCDTDSWFV